MNKEMNQRAAADARPRAAASEVAGDVRAMTHSTRKVRSAAAAFAALAALALAGCTATSEPDAVAETVAPVVETATPEPDAGAAPKPDPEPTGPETCSRMSEVVSDSGGLYWERQGTLRDLGARPFAEGEVTLDAEGIPVTYTVAPGDVEAVIAERLCAYPNLGWMNHVRDIYPDQVLWLNPNPETPVLDSPPDAEAGFQQIPYQDAMSAARQAVDAGDIDTVRAIWNDTLKGMLTDQEVINAIQQVVDSGDPDALRQLFS